ncbi:hypothetical protein ACIP93_32345 [Streptomyces sp. NPDC088745]|uniref:hypothetical protein n=1 Tax=Streptomyces sp. NPDC088745 TaxID=3365884 RepID=UPI00381A4C0A
MEAPEVPEPGPRLSLLGDYWIEHAPAHPPGNHVYGQRACLARKPPGMLKLCVAATAVGAGAVLVATALALWGR